jgi:hypothetical protein
MKIIIVGCLVALGLMSSPASADIANLTGHYICVKNCNGMLRHSAYVTQNGWDLNLLTGANEPLRAPDRLVLPEPHLDRGVEYRCCVLSERLGHSVRQWDDLAQALPLLRSPLSLRSRLLIVIAISLSRARFIFEP